MKKGNWKVEEWNGQAIRFVEKDGQWWAVAADVIEALGYENVSHTLQDYYERWVGKYDLPHPQSPKKKITVKTLNEKGIYRLIMRSNRPEAEDFQDWVYDLLKQIREEVLEFKAYEAFRMTDKEHQKDAMRRLNASLRKPEKIDYIHSQHYSE